ncbi:AI-2E family transporter [Branchiibius sp. NY16-3462-2]|uniref:AI-2E family transporter n=1 Tax=Branchiibius sp. NY16-3462-2 TaxID=1807500 RepID=UPI00079B43B5|nr:AI-2E family transporter [Branchiibius sp. NY16-3462-2]KYH45194.1 hypothetical protein AZH51_15100 [Branchiibius sp. NY16-3462-2]
MADLKVLSDESDRPFWRRAWLVVGIALLCTLVGLIVWRGSGLIINVVIAWFVALAMEPAVAKLSQRMRRGVATGLVMVIAAICVVAFILVFGNLFIDQLVSLIKAVPSITDNVLTWWNKITGSSMSSDTLLKNLDLSNTDLAGYAQNVAGGVLGLIASIVSGFLGLFVLAFFAFYISASMPQLRMWCATRMKPHRQVPFLAAWDIMKIKVGGYMAARVVLAAINSACSAIAFYLIDLPYWLPLALWTGLVAQFVPNVGTYISIILPVIVGLTSGHWINGVWVLAYALIYQQIENLTIEPNISARAVDLHPAVSFGAAVLGGQLFGVAGALLGVPIGATCVALTEIYKTKYPVTDETQAEVASLVAQEEGQDTGEPAATA